ncbi:hypothetical protein MRX96_048116 [Rhipicephalus microplus]
MSAARQTRIKHLAFFYCWLSPRLLLRPWALMRLSTWAEDGTYSQMELLEPMHNAMKTLGLRTALNTDAVASVLCIIVADTELQAPEYVICACMWHLLPYMVVYAVAEKIHSELSIILAALLNCDPALLVCGISEDPNSTHIAALVYATGGIQRQIRRRDCST